MPALLAWLLSIMPLCFVVTIGVVEFSAAVPDQPYGVVKAAGIPEASGVQAEKPLKISWYDPDLGGINCMEPCDQMATGVKVTEARYGRTAACIPEWTAARRVVVIPGLGRFECLDTGGAIKEHGDYIWIDLLLHEPMVPFGSLVDGWYLE